MLKLDDRTIVNCFTIYFCLVLTQSFQDDIGLRNIFYFKRQILLVVPFSSLFVPFFII